MESPTRVLASCFGKGRHAIEEDGSRKTEDESRKTEVGRQKTEVGSRKTEDESRKLEVKIIIFVSL